MKPLTLEEVIDALEGMCDRPAPVGSVAGISTDTRTVGRGDLFIAIAGERFDGHDFVGEAFERGAFGAVVRGDFELPVAGGRSGGVLGGGQGPLLIRVDDPVRALGRLAQYYRRSIIDGSVTVVAVTGSNGKTTTKTMIAHVLGGRWQGRASIKSFNNEIGVPLTLLSVEPADAFVVCEVGTNAPGEIGTLARLIEPEVAVITGVSEAHLEGLGSLDAIATEKLSLLRELRPEGCAVLNADCEVLRETLRCDRDLAKIKCVTFGQWPDADLRLTDVEVSPVSGGDPDEGSFSPVEVRFRVNDRFAYRLGVPGRHNVSNALAAIAVARRFGMDHEEIATRLASFRLPPMRLEYERLGGLTLINDAYNANPASLAAAVDVLVDMPTSGRRVLIVGDMRELGAQSERLHREAAERIGRSGVDVVIAVGQQAKLIAETVRSVSGKAAETHAYGSVVLARRRLVSYLRRDDTVLMKGSRLVALEKLVPVIRDWVTSPGAKRSSKKRLRSARRLTA